METKITTTIVSRTDKIRFGYYHPGREDWVELQIDNDFGEAAKELQCSEKLISALVYSFDVLQARICDDLADIWKRLDRLDASQG